MGLHRASVRELGVRGGSGPLEKLLQPVHGQVQVECVHVPREHVDLAAQLGTERRPVPLQILAQVVVMGPEVLGDAAVDRSRAKVP